MAAAALGLRRRLTNGPKLRQRFPISHSNRNHVNQGFYMPLTQLLTTRSLGGNEKKCLHLFSPVGSSPPTVSLWSDLF